VSRFKVQVLVAMLAVSVIAVSCGRSGSNSDNSSGGNSKSDISAKCKGTLEATEIGVTADTISVEVMADTGSPLAPGLFQGNVDAMNGFAKYVNANGGIGCRQLKVEAWDSKLDATESKNGLINACQNSLALVGGNALFNPDVTVLGNCVDKAGQPVGLPDFAALANDINEQCADNSFVMTSVAESCKTLTGTRDLTAFIGQMKFYQTLNPNLTGIYLVPGDLPTTVQSATYQIETMRLLGINLTNTPKVSGRLEQAGFTPFVQMLKAGNGNFVYNGSNDQAMIKMRKESAAQGLTDVNVWACSIACYTPAFKAAGSAVDGTYVWLSFLPFEEASSNAAVKNYVDSVAKPDSFGAQAWQSGMAFKKAIDEIVAEKGPNAITRAAVIEKMKTLEFDADGWIGKRTGTKSFSDCFVMLQAKGGTFERVFPSKVGTMDCKSTNLTKISIDPQEAAKLVK